MHYLRYRLTTRSPLVISQRSGDVNMVKTEKYISGTLVLGILASRFIAMQKVEAVHKDNNFYNWFLAGRLQISNAYICSQDEYGKEHVHFPTPLSIKSEKHVEQIITAYDHLWLEQEPPVPTDYVGKFCLVDGAFLQTQSVETAINFHHARDREKGVSKEGLIFNYESISADPVQIFAGKICGGQADLKNLLQTCDKKWPAFIGRSRNAQYGAVDFEIIDAEPAAVPSQVTWPRQYDDEEKAAEYISMTLLSNLLLYNEHGYPTTEVSMLQAELQKFLGAVVIKKAFVKKTEVENFVGVWQLKKPSETCFAAGSVFLLKVDQNHLQQLAEIQQHGLGERRHEGFGQCVFGTQTHPELKVTDENKKQQEKPSSTIPETTKAIIRNIIVNEIAQKIEFMAAQAQDGFDRLPSNTLITRLEAMAKNAGMRSVFVANINKLRDIAFGQLKRCVSRERNLLEFLAAFRLDQDSLAALANGDFEAKPLEKLREIKNGREFILIKDLERAIGKELTDSQKLLLLQHAGFSVDPASWDDFFRKNDTIKSLSKEIEFKIEDDEKLKHEFSQRYFVTFFSMMRKRAIAAEKEGYDVRAK